MQDFIQASGLVKKYGERCVVSNLDLTIREGEVLAVIGPNGAGKSTTLDLLLGLRRPDEGSIRYWTSNPHQQMGVQLQATPFFPGLNALENMRMFAAFYTVKLTDRQIEEYLARCGLEAVARTDAARLSGGQQKRLAIAMTLAHDPKLLFLDEPTAALDPRARREVRELIRSLADAGTSVVFTSHDMEEVHKLATRIVVISQGRLIAEGSPEALMAQSDCENLEELYLCLTGEG